MDTDDASSSTEKLETAFLLGTGPSLADFDWSAVPDGAHICSVNGAAILAPRFDSMVFSDRVQRLLQDYGEPIRAPLTTPDVIRITPNNRRGTVPGWVGEVEYSDRNGGQSADRACLHRGRSAFDGRLPIFWEGGLSCTFALLWLVQRGHRDIVLVGHDMLPGKDARHFYDDSDEHRLSLALERQYSTLRALWPQAVQRGITLRVAAPSRLLDFMPPWEPAHVRTESRGV